MNYARSWLKRPDGAPMAYAPYSNYQVGAALLTAQAKYMMA